MNEVVRTFRWDWCNHCQERGMHIVNNNVADNLPKICLNCLVDECDICIANLRMYKHAPGQEGDEEEGQGYIESEVNPN